MLQYLLRVATTVIWKINAFVISGLKTKNTAVQTTGKIHCFTSKVLHDGSGPKQYMLVEDLIVWSSERYTLFIIVQ
jgi:hypothetical protein